MGDKHPLPGAQPRCTGVLEPRIPTCQPLCSSWAWCPSQPATWQRGLVLCMGVSTGPDPACTSPQSSLSGPTLGSTLSGPECGPPGV